MCRCATVPQDYTVHFIRKHDCHSTMSTDMSTVDPRASKFDNCEIILACLRYDTESGKMPLRAEWVSDFTKLGVTNAVAGKVYDDTTRQAMAARERNRIRALVAVEDAATLACKRRYEAECKAKSEKTKAEKEKRIAYHKEAAAQIRQAKEKAAAEVKEAERIAYENRVAEERKRDAEEKAADEASLASWNEGQLKAAENGIPSFDCCTLMIKAMKMSVTGEGGQSAENQEGHWIHCDEKRVQMADRMIELHECTGCPSRICSTAISLYLSRLALSNRK
jgi:hypothetical protein